MYNYIPLEQAADILDSYRKPVNSKERLNLIKGKPLDELFPYYGATGQVGWIDSFLTDGEYILLGEDGAPFLNPYAEKAYIIHGKTWVNNHAHILHSKMNNEFLCYYLNYFNYKNYVSGTTRLKLTQAQMRKIPIPNIPSDEQFRIVARIEELFSELDKAVDTLKTTKEQLEVYRQAVLKEIFDSVSTTSVHIKDVCLDIKVGIVIKPTQYYVSENGVPAFRNANVRRGYINDTDWVMISKEGHQQNCRSEVHTNDVLISRSGANLGMASVVPARYNGYNAIDVVIAVPDISKVIPEFLAQYTNSPMGRAIVKKNERGAAQGHLNVSAYANLPIGVPDLQEQEKLVKQISDRLSVCDSIEKIVDTALAQADAMRQSILKQAFEGKL